MLVLFTPILCSLFVDQNKCISVTCLILYQNMLEMFPLGISLSKYKACPM